MSFYARFYFYFTNDEGGKRLDGEMRKHSWPFYYQWVSYQILLRIFLRKMSFFFFFYHQRPRAIVDTAHVSIIRILGGCLGGTIVRSCVATKNTVEIQLTNDCCFWQYRSRDELTCSFLFLLCILLSPLVLFR